MQPKALAAAVVRALDDKKAMEVQVFHITELSTLGDYLVLATGSSTTHIRALSDEVEVKLKEQGVTPNHIEGRATNWYLLDYGSVMVHIFGRDARAFYNLERLWADAPPVDPATLTDD